MRPGSRERSGLTKLRKSFFRAFAELLCCRTAFSFPGKDSDCDALWFGRQADEFDAIVGRASECIRRDRYAGGGADRGKNTRPAVLLLDDARFIIRARENRGEVFFVTRILLVHEANEWFARSFGQGDGPFFREGMIA